MRTIGAVAVSGLLLVASVASGGTIRVPEDVPTVLAAVDLAVPGDSVLIGPGTWTDRATRIIMAENGPHQYSACAYARGGVVIRGAGPGVTTLDVEGDADPLVADIVFVQRPGEGPLRVEGLSLTGASGTVGGWAVTGLYSDGLEIQSCRFEGNRKAVSVGSCPLTMTDCEVISNSSPTSGAIVLASRTPIHLTRCRFEGNTGICVQTNYDEGDGPAIFQDCAFVRNRGPGFGTALNLQNVGNYLVEGCLFQENVAEVHQEGGAVSVVGGYGEIRNSVFAYDSCYALSSVGAGIRWWQAGGSVVNNTFVGCHSTANGAAFSSNLSSVTFRGNVVAHSTGGAGVNASNIGTLVSGCNLFWTNTRGNWGSWVPTSSDFRCRSAVLRSPIPGLHRSKRLSLPLPADPVLRADRCPGRGLRRRGDRADVVRPSEINVPLNPRS